MVGVTSQVPVVMAGADARWRKSIRLLAQLCPLQSVQDPGRLLKRGECVNCLGRATLHSITLLPRYPGSAPAGSTPRPRVDTG